MLGSVVVGVVVGPTGVVRYLLFWAGYAIGFPIGLVVGPPLFDVVVGLWPT